MTNKRKWKGSDELNGIADFLVREGVCSDDDLESLGLRREKKG